MKRNVMTLTLGLLTALSAGAQTIYDATTLAQKELNGTARFVGMGGAMGALGGDISTIATNPAGIGIYRSNDVMTSFSYSAFGTESTYEGQTVNVDKNRWSFDNAGFVYSMKYGNQTALRYINFGFSYHKAKNFYRNTRMEGLINVTPDDGIVSQTYQMATQANSMFDSGCDIAQIGDAQNLFDNNNVGWLAALGWNGWLYDEDYHNNGQFAGYIPYPQWQPYGTFHSQERGGVNEYNFNVSFNVNDRVYFGVTLGAYDLNYSKRSFYDEDYDNGEGYALENWTDIDGSGIDLKFGVIFRPIETSPLRIGLAIHTPTFYDLTLATRARLVSDVVTEGSEIERIEVDSYEELGGNYMNQEYKLRTPWKFNASLGYTVGSMLALGAEYEYQDYSTMKFQYPDGYEMEWENSTAQDMLKAVNTLRLGAELKVIPEFALRAGYNYTTAAYTNDAWKDLPANSIMTDTDFSNSKSKNAYTLGIGYRGSNLYADLAYQYTTQKADFFAFDDEYLNKTELTHTRSQVLLTVGVRF